MNLQLMSFGEWLRNPLFYFSFILSWTVLAELPNSCLISKIDTWLIQNYPCISKCVPLSDNLVHRKKNNYINIFVLFLLCFVLGHINLIGHLTPNQVKENKSEKKFKGKVLGINDKL